MSKLRRKSKANPFKKNVKKTVCYTMAAATILAQTPYTVSEDVYGAVSMNTSGQVSQVMQTGQRTAGNYVAMPQVDEEHYIDISKQVITDNKIMINLEESGDYVLTGSNLINEVYVDTQIVVAKGAEVNLWLDGAYISNDDGKYSCGTYRNVITPFRVEGILNLYMEDTTIFEVNLKEVFFLSDEGVLNIMASKEEAVLQLQGLKEEWYDLIGGYGRCRIYGGDVDIYGAIATEEFYMEDGNLDCGGIHATDIRIDGGVINSDLNNQTYLGDWVNASGIGMGYNQSCDSIVINGGIITARSAGDWASAIGTVSEYNEWYNSEEDMFYHKSAVDVTINGGTIYAYGGGQAYADIGMGKEKGNCGILTVNGGNIVHGNIAANPVNVSGEAVFAYEFKELPLEKQIVGVNGFCMEDVHIVTEEAVVSKEAVESDISGMVRFYVPKEDQSLVCSDGKVYEYSYDSNTDTFIQKEDAEACRIIYQDEVTGEVIESRYWKKGWTLPVLESEMYDYTYKLDGQPITDKTVIENDCVVEVGKALKVIVVTIDGRKETFFYGDSLPEGSIYMDKANDKYYTPDTKITKELQLESATLDHKNPSALSIDSTEDIANFVWLVGVANADKLDAVMNADVTVSDSALIYQDDEYTMYGICNWERPYAGTFDGNGYTMTYDNTSVPLFNDGFSGTIRNLNLEGQINYQDDDIIYRCSSIIGLARGDNIKLENCSSSVNLIVSEDVSFEPGGFIGYASGENIIMENCCYTGTVSGESVYNAGGLIGSVYSNLTVNNCYVAAEFSCPNLDSYTENAFYGNTSYSKDNFNINNSYYLRAVGDSTVGTQFSEEQMASGELTWLLNGSNLDKEPVWYQNLGGENADKMPVLNPNHGIVYKTITEGKVSFTNAVSKVLDVSDIKKVEFAGEQPVYDGETLEHPVVVTLPRRELVKQATDVALTVQPATKQAVTGNAVSSQAVDLGPTYEFVTDEKNVTVAAVAVFDSADAGHYESYVLKNIEVDWADYYHMAEEEITVDVTEADQDMKEALGLFIAPKSIEGAEVSLGKELVYNGKMQVQTVSYVSVDGFVVSEELYEVTGNVQKDAGKYQLLITAKDDCNFTGSVTVDYEIAKVQIARVDITGVTQPKQGESLDITADCTTAGVKIIDVSWYKGNDKVTDSVAAYETAYTVKIMCAVENGNYSWMGDDYDMPVTIDGQTALNTVWDDSANGGTGAFVVTYTYEATESAPQVSEEPTPGPSESTVPEPGESTVPEPSESMNPSEEPIPGPTGSQEPTDTPTPGPIDSQEPTGTPTPGPTGSQEPTDTPTPGTSDEPTTSPKPTDDVMAGDVDKDSKVTLSDAQMALKIALKIIGEPTNQQEKAADVDKDNKVTLADAQLILKYALKIINKFEE